MQTDSIVEVGMDEQGRLYIQPAALSFPLIYREAAGIYWDHSQRRLHSTQLKDWTHLQWFQHIINTLGSSIHLCFTPATNWVNIPSEARTTMQEWLIHKPQEPLPMPSDIQKKDESQRRRNYEAIQEPHLKKQAKKLFLSGEYGAVIRIEAQIQYPEFLSPSEHKIFDLARQRSLGREK